MDKLHWPTLDNDVEAFVRRCLVCHLSASCDKVSPPLGLPLQAVRIRKRFHFNYLYIVESSIQDEYIIILTDDFSGYVFHRFFKSANAKDTASTLLKYFSTFTSVFDWFPDHGHRFRNKVLEVLASVFGYKHRILTADAPWTNGIVESVCRQVFWVMRAHSSNLQASESDCPKVVPSIQSATNKSLLRCFKNCAPLKVCASMKPEILLSMTSASPDLQNWLYPASCNTTQTLGWRDA